MHSYSQHQRPSMPTSTCFAFQLHIHDGFFLLPFHILFIFIHLFFFILAFVDLVIITRNNVFQNQLPVALVVTDLIDSILLVPVAFFSFVIA